MVSSQKMNHSINPNQIQFYLITLGDNREPLKPYLFFFCEGGNKRTNWKMDFIHGLNKLAYTHTVINYSNCCTVSHSSLQEQSP